MGYVVCAFDFIAIKVMEIITLILFIGYGCSDYFVVKLYVCLVHHKN